MQRLALLCIVLICAGVLVYPILAAEPSPTPKATPAASAEPDFGELAVNAAVNRVEGAVESATSKVTRNDETARHAATVIGAFLRADVFGFSVGHLVISMIVLIMSLLFRNIISVAIISRLLKFADNSRLDKRLVVALTKPFSFFLLLFGFYVALLILPLNEHSDRFIGSMFRGLTTLTIVWAIVMMTDVFADFLQNRMAANSQSVLSGFAPLIKKSLKIFVLAIGLLMAIDNMGYNVTGIIATLGLGTAALALASQDTLKNAFGALMIAMDRPFKVGDWIQVGDKVDGDVESIGLRSTKVRTWPKTVLSIPNGVLANEYINNWSRMPKRRIKQVVGISYEASADDMEKIVEDIRQLLREDEGVQQDFILVNFTDFGDSSLDILVYYFTTTVAWIDHMNVRQRVNCKIMKAIRNRGLSIAFPARTVYFDGATASAMAGVPYQSRWRDDVGPPGDMGADSPP